MLHKDDYMQVDQMINEGLGGGFILHEYDAKKFELPKMMETNKLRKVKQEDAYHDDFAIDQMINEGLGGGFILYHYDYKKFEKPKVKEQSIGA